ncbi:unnamed protein product [Gongylonema pulchrum]|uniref:Uncharacterized protein n=1 Tax=Gongylonema pulchrum TaxID=637853 RepID=A0A183EU97_9BILA|nr:unnamed protein product [Gongylonema pulchrum]
MFVHYPLCIGYIIALTINGLCLSLNAKKATIGQIRNVCLCKTTAGNFVYHGPLPHIGRYKPSRGATYFSPPELKMELLQRQLAIQCRAEPSLYPDVPQNVEYFQNLVPLENIKFTGGHVDRGIFGTHITTVYKAINVRDGMPYCLRRIHNQLRSKDPHTAMFAGVSTLCTRSDLF